MRILRMFEHQPAAEKKIGRADEENEILLEEAEHQAAHHAVPVAESENTPAQCELPDRRDSDPTEDSNDGPDLAGHTQAWCEVEDGKVPDDLLDELLDTTENSVGIPYHANLAWLLSQCHRSEEAVDRIKKDLEVSPDDVELKVIAAKIYQRTGDFEGSRELLEDVIKNSPKNLVAKRLHANALMCLGKWKEGLLELEMSRGELTSLQKEFCQDISRLWTGQDLAGKHIVVVSDGRQSDQIQFSRYINEFRKLRPKRVGFVCDAEMVELMRSLAEINRVDSKLFEPFDYFIPVESLPLRLGADSATIPGTPYLHCNSRKVAAKRTEIQESKPLIGFCWRDRQTDGVDEADTLYKKKGSSLDLEPLEWHLKELAMDYDIVAFQEDLRLDERELLNRCGCLIVEQEEFKDFMGIAEWIACLDSLITVDSPMAHLAGAIGIKAHVLLPLVSDWKWDIEEGKSKWYPNLIIHQKRSENCWNECVGEVFDKLRLTFSMQKAS